MAVMLAAEPESSRICNSPSIEQTARPPSLWSTWYVQTGKWRAHVYRLRCGGRSIASIPANNYALVESMKWETHAAARRFASRRASPSQ
ncbi:uncharacterized protein SPSK_04690 [Sporothrix schenckii 1099-18]|uniref:Uncharacterized protein n=1 Tax=Sporothrix schenckii 1099-18 TaxID=1397361 RepID=A0A0F2M4S0_SPOSC|nr:uncharacterized protein SPSK_04690 [Sporothrix schenckii 1099-18]KJR83181.1 hypothetical protein SPSK_04690 [Sporothrix schenckii 1099-18]